MIYSKRMWTHACLVAIGAFRVFLGFCFRACLLVFGGHNLLHFLTNNEQASENLSLNEPARPSFVITLFTSIVVVVVYILLINWLPTTTTVLLVYFTISY